MDDRKFTIQEVEAQTQVPAATLRQWERRYGFPKPERSDNGYRLFSSFDMQQIEAMRDYIEDGMASSQAAKLVQYQLAKPLSSLVGSFDKYTGALTEAFLNLDEAKANQVLSEAHALHSVSDVFTHILQASVFDLGEKWHAGEIDIATEHFASNYAQARLRSLLNSQPEYAANTTIIVACAPFEQHELGALMLAVMLRQAAYHVIYLGANTPVKDLKILSERSKATAVLISITTETALKELLKEAKLLPNLAPFVALGGNIVNSAAFDPPKGIVVLTGNAKQAVEQIKEVMNSTSHKVEGKMPSPSDDN